MKVEVSSAIDELRRQFPDSSVTEREDGQGGAYVTIDAVVLGHRYLPSSSWMGFQIPAQYPYADIYPVFVDASVARADGIPFVPPVTPGHTFEGRPALQVSRRNGAVQSGLQTARAKVLKVLDFLEKLQ